MKLELNDADIKVINHERHYNPHHRVRLKMEVLWLKHLGKNHEEVMQIKGISYNTVVNYLRDYRQKGLSYLLENRFNKPKSLINQRANLINTLRA